MKVLIFGILFSVFLLNGVDIHSIGSDCQNSSISELSVCQQSSDHHSSSSEDQHCEIHCSVGCRLALVSYEIKIEAQSRTEEQRHTSFADELVSLFEPKALYRPPIV